jgi:2-methylisocitrate lyase-like PEP mutase family enzyme
VSHAEELRALHHRDTPLLLANAWDAASAQVIEAAGFPAVATTSGGVAEALGFEDGERAPAAEMLGAVARIARVVGVPVSADAEAGWGLASSELGRRLLETGASGCNFEDSDHARPGALRPPGEQAERLSELRAAGLVVNARVDTYLRGVGRDEEERFEETVRRAAGYLEAGADCVYPILVADAELIGRLVRAIDGPVNILLRPGSPTLDELTALGVRRISVGSGIYRAAMRVTGEIAAALLARDAVVLAPDP